MTKFIKVTECNGSTLLLNTSQIENVCIGAKGTDTYIKLLKNANSGKENYFFVKEPVKEIWNMLNIVELRQPIIMSEEEAREYNYLKKRWNK